MPLPSLFRRLVLAGPLLAVGLPPASHASESLEMLPDGTARARIGDIKLYHDPRECLIEGEGDAFGVFCRGPECGDPLMSIVAVPEELTSCSPGVAAACRGMWGVGREAFVEILSGLRPRN